MFAGLRYLTYMLLIALGACSYHGAERSNWDTIFADANSCKGDKCKNTVDDASTEGRGKGGSRR